MAWKKSKDGGIDFDVNLDIRREKNEEISFSATTVLHNENFEEAQFDEHNIYNGKTLLG